MRTRRITIAAAALLVVVAVALVLVHRATESTTDRLAGWVEDTGCPKVVVSPLPRSEPSAFPDTALLEASTSATDLECYGPNGDVFAYRFSARSDIDAALARFRGTSPRRVCVAGRTVIASHLLGGPPDALAQWCERLSGTLRRV